MKKFLILLVTIIFLLTLQISTYVKDIRYMLQERPIDISIKSVYDAYKYSKNYWDKYICKKTYELYQITATYDRNMIGTWTFVYTKRSGYFRDVYFIIINTKNNIIKVSHQDDAKRMYGMDFTVDLDNWVFDDQTIWKYAENTTSDEVHWTVFEDNRLSIHFMRNDLRVYHVDINPITGSIIKNTEHKRTVLSS